MPAPRSIHPGELLSAPLDRAPVAERLVRRLAEWPRTFPVHPLTLGVYGFFTVVFLYNAWVSDDAFIIFRSIEQWFAGNGPRWNPHERVQAFTSPLWFFALSAVRLITRDLFIGSVLLSYALCVGTIALLRRLTPSRDAWVVVTMLFLCSKSIMDFSSSGLENPLGYVLLAALLAGCRYGGESTPVRFIWVAGAFGGLLLVRHDSLFLAAPIMVLATTRSKLSGWMKAALFAVGLSPLVAWTGFSLFYYGAPLPNPAYAKLSHQLPRIDLVWQGLKYILVSAAFDPLGIAVVATAVASVRHPDPLIRAIGIGVSAQLAYIVWVGGDFMSGRFLAFAIVASIPLVAAMISQRVPQLERVALCLAVYGILTPLSPLNSALSDRLDVTVWGVADERGVYAGTASLPRYVRDHFLGRTPLPYHGWSMRGAEFKHSGQRVLVAENVGFLGYAAGLDQIILDELALTDPFLARLPSDPEWRIGHFRRRLPEGYLESVISGHNLLRDNGLRRTYDTVRLLTQGDLLAPGRLTAILEINLPRIAKR